MEEKKATNLVVGKLFLIPTTLGDNAPFEVLPLSIKRTLEPLVHFIAENEKTARRFIKKIVPTKNQGDLKFERLNKFTEPQDIPSFLDPCIQGFDVGLLSEAGCPGIADPGADVVALAHEKRIKVVPLVGPSSILLAMMASGLNGQNFAFNGYLPIDAPLRRKALKSYENLSKESGQAQLFIETPYRNDKLLAELKRSLKPQTKLCIAVNVTQKDEFISTKTINEWKRIPLEIQKRPAIFILQA